MTEAFVAAAEQALAQQDAQLGALIRSQKLLPRTGRSGHFASLCRSIIGQQVSVAAANAIFGRFQEQTQLLPAKAAALTEEQAKLIGLSRQKMSYLKDLGAHFAANPGIYNHLAEQTDEQVIAELTAIRGVGTWTAQMFLMFTLDRPDVFAPDDVGLQRAMMRLYGWPELPAKKVLLAQAEHWRPYRSVASLHLWQSLDVVPLPEAAGKTDS